MQMNRSKINVLKNKNDNSFEELRKLAKSTGCCYSFQLYH